MKILIAVVASVVMSLSIAGCAVKSPQKYAIILQAGTETHEGTARALHAIVCDFCSTAFKVKDALAKEGAHFEGEYQGHPSIAKWVDQGYQLVVL